MWKKVQKVDKIASQGVHSKTNVKRFLLVMF